MNTLTTRHSGAHTASVRQGLQNQHKKIAKWLLAAPKTMLIPHNISVNINSFTYYWPEFYHYRIQAMQNDNVQCVWAQDTFMSSCCLCTPLPQQQWLIFPEIGCHIWSLCHFLFFHYTHNRWKILSCLYSVIRFGRKCHSLMKQRESSQEDNMLQILVTADEADVISALHFNIQSKIPIAAHGIFIQSSYLCASLNKADNPSWVNVPR